MVLFHDLADLADLHLEHSQRRNLCCAFVDPDRRRERDLCCDLLGPLLAGSLLFHQRSVVMKLFRAWRIPAVQIEVEARKHLDQRIQRRLVVRYRETLPDLDRFGWWDRMPLLRGVSRVEHPSKGKVEARRAEGHVGREEVPCCNLLMELGEREVRVRGM